MYFFVRLGHLGRPRRLSTRKRLAWAVPERCVAVAAGDQGEEEEEDTGAEAGAEEAEDEEAAGQMIVIVAMMMMRRATIKMANRIDAEVAEHEDSIGGEEAEAIIEPEEEAAAAAAANIKEVKIVVNGLKLEGEKEAGAHNR